MTDTNVPIGLVRARRAQGQSPPNTRDCAREWFGPYMALFPSWLRTADGGRYWFCWDSRTGRLEVRSMITLRRWECST